MSDFPTLKFYSLLLQRASILSVFFIILPVVDAGSSLEEVLQ